MKLKTSIEDKQGEMTMNVIAVVMITTINIRITKILFSRDAILLLFPLPPIKVIVSVCMIEKLSI